MNRRKALKRYHGYETGYYCAGIHRSVAASKLDDVGDDFNRLLRQISRQRILTGNVSRYIQVSV